MPERWRSSAARDLAKAVKNAGGQIERVGKSRLRITGPGGTITIQEPATVTRRDLRRNDSIAKVTGLVL